MSTAVAEQIIIAVGGKDEATLCQLIAINPTNILPNNPTWLVESYQEPVDIKTPTSSVLPLVLSPLPGSPPAIVYDPTGQKLITTHRVREFPEDTAQFNATYSAEITFQGGVPSLSSGQILPGTTYMATSLLLVNESMSVLSQDSGSKNSTGGQIIAQPKTSDATLSATPPKPPPGPPLTPWTSLPLKSNEASQSPVKNPFARASFVPFQSNSTDVIVLETRMNTEMMSASGGGDTGTDYSFNAYSMPTSNFTKLQADGDLLWNEYTINATAPASTFSNPPIISNVAPLVVPVAGNTANQLLYCFYSFVDSQIPFSYFSVPLSRGFSLMPNDDGTITATPESGSVQKWPFYVSQPGQYREVPRSSQLPAQITGDDNNGSWNIQSAVPVMVSCASGESAVFVFFIGGNWGQGLQPGIGYASQQLGSDGSLDPNKWFWGDKMIPLDLQTGSTDRPCLISATTVPASKNYFPTASTTPMIMMW